MAETKKILLIEDDSFLSSLMKARLEKEGFGVIQAFDGEEGLSAIKKEKPAVIVLDLIMPKVSGFEVMEYISMNVDVSKTPVVVLSNLAQESDFQKAKRLGAREFFVKIRISIDDLVTKIKELVGQSAVSV